jgi:hypothetical protein
LVPASRARRGFAERLHDGAIRRKIKYGSHSLRDSI